MKSRLTILAAVAFILGACSTGSYVSDNYSDDIYFNPGELPPPIAVDEKTGEPEVAQKAARRMIISDIQENDEGSNTMNNYILDATEEDGDALSYSMDQMDPDGTDTTVYYNDDEVKYVINNYYDGNTIDYAYRIRRFHRPHFYDPFYWDSWYYDSYYYDPFYYPSWSLSWNWGWGSRWYSPYYSWGHYGYSPFYSSWYSPYYRSYPYYNSWYGGYYGGNYTHRWLDSEDYRYGKRRSTGTNVLYGGGRSMTNGVSGRSSATRTSGNIIKSGREGTDSRTAAESSHSSRRSSSSSGVREAVTGRNSINATREKSAEARVLTERRRSTASESNIRSVIKDNQNTSSNIRTYTRPGSAVTTKSNSQSSASAARPRVVTKSSSDSKTRYTQPRSSSSYNQKYRTSSTYTKSTSRSQSRTYQAPARSSSTRTYRSTPTRSSSSQGSYRSSGSSGSRSVGSSQSSSSGRSGSSSSGRRR